MPIEHRARPPDEGPRTEAIGSGHTRGWRTAFGGTLAFASGITALMFPATAVLSAFIIDDFEISRGQFGLIVAAFASTSGFLAPAAGRVADALGGKRITVAALVLTSGTFAGFAAAPTFLAAVAIAVVGRAGKAALDTASTRLVMTNLEVGSRGLVMGFKQSGVHIGGFVAGALLPLGASTIGWRPTFLIVALVPLVAITLVMLVVPGSEQRVMMRSRATARAGYPASVRWLTIYAFLMGSSGGAVFTYVPLYAQEGLSLSVRAAGLIAATVSFVGIASRVLWSKLTERLDHFAVPLGVIAFAASIGLALLVLAPHVGWPMLVAGAILAGSTLTGWNPVALLSVIRDVGSADAGGAAGSVLFGMAVGAAVGPAAFGYSVDATGSYVPGWIGTGAILVGAVVLTRMWLRSGAGDSPGSGTTGG